MRPAEGPFCRKGLLWAASPRIGRFRIWSRSGGKPFAGRQSRLSLRESSATFAERKATLQAKSPAGRP